MKFKAKIFAGPRGRIVSYREWEGASLVDVHNKVRAAYPEAVRIELEPVGTSKGAYAIEHYDKLFGDSDPPRRVDE